jgi:hypothetical protein
MWYYFALLLLVGRSSPHSLSVFCAFMYRRSYVLYRSRWYTSKGKKRRQTRTLVKQKTRESANEWCGVDIRIHVCITKKAFASLFIRLSFFLVFASFFLALFFRFSLVLLSSSSSSLSLFVDIRTAILFVCSMSFTLPWCMSDGRREREREMMRGLYNDSKCLCVCICVCTPIDYIFYLWRWWERGKRVYHRCQFTSNRPVVSS